MALANGVNRLLSNEEKLRRECDQIEEYQKDLEMDLGNIEDRLAKELQALQDQDITQDDLDREQMYVLAEDMDQHLNQVMWYLTIFVRPCIRACVS
jgi:predicted transcriptional regulator